MFLKNFEDSFYTFHPEKFYLKILVQVNLPVIFFISQESQNVIKGFILFNIKN